MPKWEKRPSSAGRRFCWVVRRSCGTRTKSTKEPTVNKQAILKSQALGESGHYSFGVPVRRKIKKKWAWHYRALQELKERLLESRTCQLGTVAGQLEPYSMDMADRATDEFDHNLALSLLSSEQDALIEVEEAMHRILDDTYGVCQVSGRPIAEARLEAIPWTRYSATVQARLEAEGVVGHAHLGEIHSLQTAVASESSEEATEEVEFIEPLQ